MSIILLLQILHLLYNSRRTNTQSPLQLVTASHVQSLQKHRLLVIASHCQSCLVIAEAQTASHCQSMLVTTGQFSHCQSVQTLLFSSPVQRTVGTCTVALQQYRLSNVHMPQYAAHTIVCRNMAEIQWIQCKTRLQEKCFAANRHTPLKTPRKHLSYIYKNKSDQERNLISMH